MIHYKNYTEDVVKAKARHKRQIEGLMNKIILIFKKLRPMNCLLLYLHYRIYIHIDINTLTG